MTTVIRTLPWAPEITTFSVPFARFGFIPLGGRSTVIKLQSGKVWALASSPLDDPTLEAVKKIGTPTWIIAADTVHTMSTKAWSTAFPTADVIGPEGLAAKLKDVKVTGEYSSSSPEPKFGFEDEIEAVYFPGFINKDIAFVHKPNGGTLIQADLLFNLPGYEQYSGTPSGKPPTMMPGSALSWKTYQDRTLFLTCPNKELMARDCKRLMKLTFDKMIPCHGEVMASGAKEAFAHVYKRFLQ